MKRQQIQQQEQTTAFQKQTTHNMLLMTLEWLEKYIEVVYPNYGIRKQIHDNNIKRTDIDGNPAMAEDSLSTQLVLFRSTLRTKPPFLREEIKQEYYKWINATGIDGNDCPERLKHFLFGIHEIIEGRGEKILEDLRNEQANIDSASSEFMEEMKTLFAYSHSESKKVEKVEKSLEGKTYKDIEVKSKFGSGDVESGGQTFQQIAGTVSSSHEAGFRFFPQQEQLGIHPTNLNEVVQDVKINPQNWRIDEIITSYEFGKAKEESLLLHRTAEIDYDVMGNLKFDSQPIYRAGRFSSMEIAKIKEILLNISQSSSSTNTQQYSKSDLKEFQINADESNKDNNQITTIATISVFTALVIGGLIFIARRMNKKVKK